MFALVLLGPRDSRKLPEGRIERCAFSAKHKLSFPGDRGEQFASTVPWRLHGRLSLKALCRDNNALRDGSGCILVPPQILQWPDRAYRLGKGTSRNRNGFARISVQGE